MKTPVRLPIEVGKRYYLGDGRLVQIYNTDAGGGYPIHGALYTESLEEWTMIKFTRDGRIALSGISGMDIVWEEWTPFDKELVWGWDESYTAYRNVGFYDAINRCMFQIDGERDGYAWDNYAPFDGELPEWAKEAYKKLQD